MFERAIAPSGLATFALASLLLLGAVGVEHGAATGLPQAAAATLASADDTPGRRPSVKLEEDGPIKIELGRSRLVRTAFPVARVSVTQPAVADVQVLSPNQVLVMGNAVGLTDLLIWDRDDNVWQRDIDVRVNLTVLNDDLRKLFPDSDLRVVQSGNVLVVNGSLRRADEVPILRQFLQAHGLEHVDLTRVAGVHQVLLEVKVAEVSRNAVRALTVNALHSSNSFFGGITTGSSGGGAFNPVNIGVPAGAPAGPNVPFGFVSDVNVNPLATLFLGFPRADLQIFIQALAEDQMLRVLAEPNLVAMSGESASFLAGGEFPIPIVQGTGGGTSISVEYREFGIRLDFRPEVLGDGRIRLDVAPEVSDVSEVGAVEIQGFRIPAVITRRAETTIELKSGQSFAMAGLMNQRADARTSKIPLLGDLPILGPLFRSVRYTRGETELVVLVTASLVEPMSLATTPPLPGDLHVAPSDWELFVNGWIEGEAAPKVGPADREALSSLGLSQLRGPGAWISHGTAAAEPRPSGRRQTDARRIAAPSATLAKVISEPVEPTLHPDTTTPAVVEPAAAEPIEVAVDRPTPIARPVGAMSRSIATTIPDAPPWSFASQTVLAIPTGGIVGTVAPAPDPMPIADDGAIEVAPPTTVASLDGTALPPAPIDPIDPVIAREIVAIVDGCRETARLDAPDHATFTDTDRIHRDPVESVRDARLSVTAEPTELASPAHVTRPTPEDARHARATAAPSDVPAFAESSCGQAPGRLLAHDGAAPWWSVGSTPARPSAAPSFERWWPTEAGLDGARRPAPTAPSTAPTPPTPRSGPTIGLLPTRSGPTT